jgi:HSP20 family molecular chaperone IbpA
MFDVLMPRLNMGLRELDNLFECAIQPSFTDVCGYQEWAPASDITESDKHYLVTMEVPGVDMKKMDISYNDGELTIKGEKVIETAESESCLCTERFAGPFNRSFIIPKKVDADKIDATYKDGVLSVTLPKTEESITKKIVIH